jgi:quinol monooxygenase YgiN
MKVGYFPPFSKAMETCCPIVELRQYTLFPGKREVLIDLFEREFIETQEAVGMKVIGQFRDLDDPNRFVWLRGFSSMASREQALNDFYTGPAWRKHRETANTTMVDSDNVLLLRPASPVSGFSFPDDRPAPGANEIHNGLVVATIYHLRSSAGDDFSDFFEHLVKPIITENGASILASLVTENSANTFPALPVREGENVFIWFTRFADEAAHEEHINALASCWQQSGNPGDELDRRLSRGPEVLRLSPTARSLLHG